MKSFVVALDQGTTSSRALVFDKKGFVVASQHKEHQQIFPRSGWVEHNPEEILKNQISVFVNLLKKHKNESDELDGGKSMFLSKARRCSRGKKYPKEKKKAK